jgi:2-haloacid dehalogenase
MPYHWILFDLDNTLFDFDASSRYALKMTFEEFGVIHSDENIAVYHEVNHQCWTDFENGKMDFATLRNIRFELFAEAIKMNLNGKKMSDRYLYLLSTTDYKMEGATKLLNYLKPKYNLAVVTNGLKEVKRPQLSKPEIAHYFKAIIISEEVGVSKPHKGFFDYTFNAIGNPEKKETIIIGDSLNSDIRGGADYGIDTCWFNPNRKMNDTMIKPKFEISMLGDFLKIIE